MYTDEQLEIINHPSGHASVKAVPGSGKTYAMVGRVIKLIESGVPPKRIAVIMFNADVSKAFYKKLEQGLRGNNIAFKKDNMPVVRTLHSLARGMIHTLVQNDFLPAYSFDPEKAFLARNFIKETLKEFGIDDSRKEIENLQNIISWIKSRCSDELSYQGKKDCLETQLFNKYESIRHAHKMRFFDDLLYDTAVAVRKHPELSTILGNKVRHILVDEFQDINPCQMELIKIIAGTKAEVMIVGDVNQSIYGFRGAEPEIMLNDFPACFTNVKDYQLSRTFRFGQALSTLANHLISYSDTPLDLECISDETTPTTTIQQLSSDQYDPIRIIERSSEDGDYSQIAVLVREFALKVKTEMALIKAEIPYQVLGGESLLNHRAVISIVGYLRLAEDAQNMMSLSPSERSHTVRCMLDIPSLFVHRQLKKQLVNRLAETPHNENIFLDIADQLNTLPNLKDDDVKKHRRALSQRELIWGTAVFYDDSAPTHIILKDLYQSQLKYDKYFEFTSLKSQDVIYNKALLEGLILWSEELYESGKAKTLKDFLTYFDDTRAAYQENLNEGRTHCLTITSMHASKGLEWDTVILPELHATNLPTLDEKGHPADIEGDRRLLYVAMTRARKSLYLIGGSEGVSGESSDSSFLKEINQPKQQGKINDELC